MKSLVTAGVLCAALLIAAVSVVNAKTAEPHGADATPVILSGE